MKNPDTKAAVDKDWKLEKLPAWQVTKAKSKEGATQFMFATLMDLCHFNSSWSRKSKKYKGRVVLSCKVVKDDSRSYAVFTEQGSSASQNHDRKSSRHYCQAIAMQRTSKRRSIRQWTYQQ